MGLREEVLGSRTRTVRPQTVPTPEWPAIDGRLHVRTISALEREAFHDHTRQLEEAKRPRNVMARFVVLCCCEPDGSAVFQPGDEQALGEKPSAPIERLFDAAMAYNGMTTQAVEDLAKNSASGPGAASS
jgi:hypothetical protein